MPKRTKPLRGGKDRGIVHKPSPQQLAPSTLTSLLACTNALCRAILRHGYAWRRARPAPSLPGRQALFPERAPCPAIQSTYIKAKAAPIAASSSAFASARPPGLVLRPRSLPALRIQDSSNDAPRARRPI